MKLRSEGIVVLSKGAIEDYYPAAVSKNSPKPQRALEACAAVKSTEDLLKLSEKLVAAEETELEELFKLVSAVRVTSSGPTVSTSQETKSRTAIVNSSILR
jgi:hypothetical protein